MLLLAFAFACSSSCSGSDSSTQSVALVLDVHQAAKLGDSTGDTGALSCADACVLWGSPADGQDYVYDCAVEPREDGGASLSCTIGEPPMFCM